jgi:hypothetical protein
MGVDKFELNKGRKKDVCGEMTFALKKNREFSAIFPGIPIINESFLASNRKKRKQKRENEIISVLFFCYIG